MIEYSECHEWFHDGCANIPNAVQTNVDYEWLCGVIVVAVHAANVPLQE